MRQTPKPCRSFAFSIPRTSPTARAGMVIAIAALAAPLAAQPLQAEPDQFERRSLLKQMTDRALPCDPNQPDLFIGEHDPSIGCAKACFWHGLVESGLPFPANPPGADRFGNRGPGSTDPTDVLNNTLDIEVEPPGSILSGSNTMTIKSNVDNLTTFTFRLRWNFDVDLCTVTDSQGSYTVTPTVPFSGSNPASYARTFSLLRPINQNETFTIRVDYSGQLTEGIGLGSVVRGPQNNTSGNPGVICTLSEPYYAATWWPCKDGDVFQPGDNSDKATLTFSISAPQNFKSVANGLLIAEEPLPLGRKKYTWQTNYPLSTYLVFFASSEYNTFNATYDYGTGTMPLDFYIYTTDDTQARRNEWLKTVPMLEAFRGVYGLYPFINEKYGIYQFEFGGGMEHQTFTGQGGSGAFVEYITAHELAHQWWGDNVTCKTWQDIWINEGSATYGEALWEERKPGSSGLTALRNAMNGRRPSLAGVESGSVYIPLNQINNPSRIFSSSLSYRKAGWVLHQLRHIVGDTTFFNILQTFRTTYEGSAATTADFTTVASAVAGQDLLWYFDPWLRDVGAPEYEYGWQNVTINGHAYLRLRIEQVQGTGPTFDMPVDVRVTTAAGTTTHIVRDNNAIDYFVIPLASAPATAVVLDPDNWILEYGKTQVAYVPGPPKVIAANPAPGAAPFTSGTLSTIAITFSDNVTVSPGDFAVTRDAISVPFTLSYSAPTQTATLDFGGPLAAGAWAVAVSDNVRSAAITPIQLDGEIAVANSPASLPSGDGVFGGIAAFTFTVQSNPILPCPGDFNGSGGITVQDIFDFLAAYFAGDPSADFNDSGDITVQDIFDFLAAYFAGCP